MNGLLLLLLAGAALLSACGSSGSSAPQQGGSLAGNWQFTRFDNPDSNYPKNPDGSSPPYGLLGGFLLQKNGAVTGQVVYSVSGFDQNKNAIVCNAGSANLTQGTLSGQTVNLTFAAGSQTFTLNPGTLNSDGSMSGTYTATAGTAPDGSVCGIGTADSSGTQHPQSWKAVPVPPLSGTITGGFHSAENSDSGLSNQDFAVTGTLLQGANIGTSNATVTGTLSFLNPATNLSDYPCIPSGTVSVNGQISGNTVILQLIDSNGSNDGQIGIPSSQASANGFEPVVLESTTNGNMLQSVAGSTTGGFAYLVNTKTCPLIGPSNNNFSDTGYLCLALNSATACQQPIAISPAALTFPAQPLGTSTRQTITITNTSGAALTGLTLTLPPNLGTSGVGFSDFTGAVNFVETDATGDSCDVPLGTKFDLPSGASCTLTITFTPQESCTWMPNQGGTSPAKCPLVLPGVLTVNNVPSLDKDSLFSVPVSGIGISAIQPLVIDTSVPPLINTIQMPELDFGAEAVLEMSDPQTLTLTNTSANPVTIPPSDVVPCVLAPNGQTPLMLTLPLPSPDVNGPLNGLQVVRDTMIVNGPMMSYDCDGDSVTSNAPTFPISADTCSGTTLPPQGSCTLQFTYAPQLKTGYDLGGPDYFLELNTMSCAGADPATVPCELDAGRFPVEIKANPASPLRMSPAAGLDFGTQPKGTVGVPQTITLSNDPNDPNAADVTFVGGFVLSGPFAEFDNCPATLTKGSNCTLTITFNPKAVGNASGTITINYMPEPTGLAQKISLRGTGQ